MAPLDSNYCSILELNLILSTIKDCAKEMILTLVSYGNLGSNFWPIGISSDKGLAVPARHKIYGKMIKYFPFLFTPNGTLSHMGMLRGPLGIDMIMGLHIQPEFSPSINASWSIQKLEP